MQSISSCRLRVFYSDLPGLAECLGKLGSLQQLEVRVKPNPFFFFFGHTADAAAAARTYVCDAQTEHGKQPQCLQTKTWEHQACYLHGST